MSPTIKHLCALFSEPPSVETQNSVPWTLDSRIKILGAAFYHQIIPYQPVLNLEYGFLCNRLNQDFRNPESANPLQVVERLRAALMICELLEEIHLNYLIVPREVLRMQQQKKMLQALLTELNADVFDEEEKQAVAVGISLSQQVRALTLQTNWYRILLNRSRRVFLLFNTIGLNSELLSTVITTVDKYSVALFAHLNWFFHVPRFMTNLFLTLKHVIPGPWMNDKEKSLDWDLRLKVQMQRRWFEFANDSVWTVISALSCFLLIGGLAPVAVYLNAAAFAFDVLNIALRAYIELQRLYTLRDEYSVLLANEDDEQQKQMLCDHIRHLEARINFDSKRFALQLTNNILILAAMTLAIPAFAVNPIVIFVTALLLLSLWVVVFMLTRKLEAQRPKDNLEQPSLVRQLGFFAQKKESSYTSPTPPTEDEDIEDLNPYLAI